MKLFHWNMSEALKRYSCGDIIVMAEDIGCARIIALDKFMGWINTPETPLHYLVEDSSLWEDIYKEEWETKIKQFNEDLDREPIDTAIAIFITGSE